MVECKETILLVDDETEIIGLLRYVLEDGGYNVLAANSSEEALGILEARENDGLSPVGQLWTDNRMPPGKTGIEFVRELRQDPEKYPFVLPDMKIILMSTTERQDLGVEDKPLFNAFLPKPFNLDQVVDLAKRLLMY